MKRITNYFFRGLLVFVPAALTIFLVVWALTLFDGFFRRFFHITIPGLSFVITVAVITFIGFLASNFVGGMFFGLIDKLFTRLPVVKLLYLSFKDFINAFTGERKSFDKPVIVELTPGGPLAAGFITRNGLEQLGLSDYVAVYFPQSYNFAGSVLIFPAGRVKPLEIESSAAMAFIVSGGVAGGNA